MRRWIIRMVAATVVVAAGVAAIGFGYPLLTGPWYRSEAALVLYPRSRSLEDSQLMFPAIYLEPDGIEGFARDQCAILTSDALASKVLESPQAVTSQWFHSYDRDIEAGAHALASRVKAIQSPDSTFIALTVTLPGDPDAQEMLRTLIDVYLQERSVITRNQEAVLDSVIKKELERVERRIEGLKREQADFINNYDWQGTEPSRQQLIRLQDRRLDAELAVRILRGGAPQVKAEAISELDDVDQAELESAQKELVVIDDMFVEARAEMQKVSMRAEQIKTIQADMAEARARYARVLNQLAMLREVYRRPEASRAGSFRQPTESQRVWWVWP